MEYQDSRFSLEEFQENVLRILRTVRHTTPVSSETIKAVENATTVAELAKVITTAILRYGITGGSRTELDTTKGFMELQYPEQFPGKAR